MAVSAEQTVHHVSGVWYLRWTAISIYAGRLGENSCCMTSRVNFPVDGHLQYERDYKSTVVGLL